MLGGVRAARSRRPRAPVAVDTEGSGDKVSLVLAAGEWRTGLVRDG